MDLVHPANRMNLLFDDILFLEEARREHASMCAFFDKVVGQEGDVLQISDLLREAFEQEDARLDFIEQLAEAERSANMQAFVRDLGQLSPQELHHFAFTGESPLPLHAQPVPNILFTRDLAAVVGDHIVLSHAATAARARESIIISVVVKHHPSFADMQDRVIDLPRGVTFEGGDLLVPHPKLALIGQSERTTFGGIMSLAQELFARTSIENVLMVNLPKARYCMHLDTVFTFASPDECVVFPPMIEQTGLGNVVRFAPGDEEGVLTTEIRPNLKEALEELLDRSITFIPCGGRDTLSQHREQWTDGANFFAVAPGVVVGYERNGRTYEVMRDHDYRVLGISEFLEEYADRPYEPDGKMAVKLSGTELSRGRGGPRCMTLPLQREA